MNQLAKAIITMSSLELVGFINEQREEGKTELRHDNFMVKIENHPGIDSPKFLGQYKDSTGRKLKCYHLPKRECELMVMSESLAVQTKVYDRMTALEQVTKPKSILPVSKEFTQAFRIARLIGCDRNAAAISANNFVFQSTGTNVLSLLGQTHLEADKQALFFNVSELQPGISGVKMNKLLQAAGLQRNEDGRWITTDEAATFCRIFDTGKRHGNGTPIQQIKWSRDVLPKLSLTEEV